VVAVPGSPPIQAWVQDADASVSYRLNAGNSPAAAACFGVSASTGAVSIAASCSPPLDFVVQPLWTLLIDAVSQPAGTLTDTATAFIALSFVPQPPRLLSPPLLSTTGAQVSSLSVLENATVGFIVGSIRGYARDAPVTYTLTGSSSTCTVPPHTALRVAQLTGELSIGTAGVLDWEDCTSFALLLNLSDTSLAGWSVPVQVNVNVLDAPDAVISQVRVECKESSRRRGRL
jgi:hypothetical protein